MPTHDSIRNVFRDPRAGDEIEVYGDTLRVEAIRRHPGKVYVAVLFNGEHRRAISKASWMAYEEDATVKQNQSVIDAFD